MRKLILRSFRCLLLWVVILSRVFGIAMVMIHAIVVDVIGVISWSTGLFSRWYRTLWDLERVVFILQAAREIALIEDRTCGSKDHVGGAHKQEIVLKTRSTSTDNYVNRQVRRWIVPWEPSTIFSVD